MGVRPPSTPVQIIKLVKADELKSLVGNEAIYLFYTGHSLVKVLKCELEIYQANLSGSNCDDLQIKALRVLFK
jgi:hypothetical protein